MTWCTHYALILYLETKEVPWGEINWGNLRNPANVRGLRIVVHGSKDHPLPSGKTSS